uniref:Uncharacterized protein n=1 Tax=Arundo donax TaxID=35708 RepID=A0A0A9F6A4_ARUDO
MEPPNGIEGGAVRCVRTTSMRRKRQAERRLYACRLFICVSICV